MARSSSVKSRRGAVFEPVVFSGAKLLDPGVAAAAVRAGLDPAGEWVRDNVAEVLRCALGSMLASKAQEK